MYSSPMKLSGHQPFPHIFRHPCNRAPSKPFFLFSTRSETSALDHEGIRSHGPSLCRGRPLQRTSSGNLDGECLIDRDRFTRSFDVAALRVPAAECFALESRLRGHLLNWPRVRNVARVDGDDFDSGVKRLLRGPDGDGGQRLRSLARRAERVLGSAVDEDIDDDNVIHSPVLYRDKLAREFNFRGFLKFRNLAKISRPRKGKKKKKEVVREKMEVVKVRGKNGFAVVEVIEELDAVLDGLLEEKFWVGNWRGPTRILLLDERYANAGLDQLPEAVKNVLQHVNGEGQLSSAELVQCRLMLSYDYWLLNEVLEALLPLGMVVPTGFEIVGHIAHLNLKEEHLPFKHLIAQVVLDKNKPKIQTVVNKVDSIKNDYRTMQLEVLAGNHSLVTSVVENGLRFQVDLASVYWNSRLSSERQMLVNLFTNSDVVCDVFSGVGPLSIFAARKVRHVYANDLNPDAVEYLERNVIANKLERKVEVFNMDGRRFIHTIFANQRIFRITQVVMNLPNDAAEFLDAFIGIYRKVSAEGPCILPKVHVYGFSKADNPEVDFHERINMSLCETVADVVMHRVRLVAPGKWMLRGSFTLPRSVAFAKPVH